VWFRVNDLLPDDLQKSLPDRPPEMMHQPGTDVHEGTPKSATKTQPMPRRSPPPPPYTEPTRSASPTPVNNSKEGGGALGAFWSTQHAKDSFITEDQKGPKFDEEPSNRDATRHDQGHSERQVLGHNPIPPKKVHAKSVNRSEVGPSKDFEIKFSQEDSGHVSRRKNTSNPDSKPASQNEAFNTFVAEFDTNKLGPGIERRKSGSEEELAAEVESLKEELRRANVEKAEITSKYEKLSAICRTQRQEIQELKQDLAARNQSPNREASKDKTSHGIQPKIITPQSEKIEGTVWELQQGLFDKTSPSPEPKQWQAFADNPKPQPMSMSDTPKSVRTRNGNQNKPATQSHADSEKWGFETDNFTAVPTSSRISRPINDFNNSQRFGEPKNIENKQASQPAGWAGF